MRKIKREFASQIAGQIPVLNFWVKFLGQITGSNSWGAELEALQAITEGGERERRVMPARVDFRAQKGGVLAIDRNAAHKPGLSVATPRRKPIEAGGGDGNVHGMNCIWSKLSSASLVISMSASDWISGSSGQCWWWWPLEWPHSGQMCFMGGYWLGYGAVIGTPCSHPLRDSWEAGQVERV
jgi:hypothetical protein